MARPVADLIIVDASALYEVLIGTDLGEIIRGRLADADDLAAPHVIDVEVLSTIRKDELFGDIDGTTAHQAVEDLSIWPGERHDHRPFLPRAWELRANVRTWDAMYVALAEALGGTVLTTDTRLAKATGPQCPIDVATP
jgi:predicted nucleic acid-binding protein